MDGIAGPIGVDTTYRVGDRISFNGALGTIFKISEGPYTLMRDYPIHVLMDTGRELYFTDDGKFLKDMDQTSIEVVGTAPVIVKRYIWVTKDKDGKYSTTAFHYTQDEAEALFGYDITKVEASMLECTEGLVCS